MGVPESTVPQRTFGGVLEIGELTGRVAQAVLQETRLRLLAVLGAEAAAARGGYTLQELAAMLSCSPQNVHHHLRILADVGVVRLARLEAGERLPRQHWVSDVHTVRLVADTGRGPATLTVEMGRRGGA